MSNHHKNRDFNEILDYNVSTRELLYIHNYFENKCFNCGSKKDLTVDHHYPLEKGYSLKNFDGTLNAVLLCKKCNQKKSNKLPEKFYTKEQLKILEEKFKIKKPITKALNLKTLIEMKEKVRFSYLGKIYIGIPNRIFSDDSIEFGKKPDKFLEVILEKDILVFPLKNIEILVGAKDENS